MDLREVYEKLYAMGYHTNKNHGLKLVDYLTENYSFSSILDIGCSQGLAVKEYGHRGIASYGVDISENAIERSKKKGIKRCRQGSVVDLPYPDNYFDAVVTVDVLEHLERPDVPTAINEVIRVAKKYLFIKVAPDPERNRKWLNKLKQQDPNMELDNLHTTLMSYEEWEDQFLVTNQVELVEKVDIQDVPNVMVFCIKDEI